MKIRRADEIEKYILYQKNVSMKELYEKFDVSENTIRRDLKEILERGNVKKVYGGVIATERNSLISFEKRKVLNKELKEKIASKVAKYIKDGDVIYIDSGTTTLELIDVIKDKKVTVFTNNLNFINAAIPYKNIKVMCLSGKLKREINSFVGDEALNMLKNFNIDKAFMAASGVSIKFGITNSSAEETRIKQMAIRKSLEVFLLVDSTKFGKVGMVTFSDFDNIDYIVSDKIKNKYIEFFNEKNIEILV